MAKRARLGGPRSDDFNDGLDARAARGAIVASVLRPKPLLPPRAGSGAAPSGLLNVDASLDDLDGVLIQQALLQMGDPGQSGFGTADGCEDVGMELSPDARFDETALDLALASGLRNMHHDGRPCS